jgi:hypothetical protein
LTANEASISGKLVAGQIESETINDIQKLLADIKNQPMPDAKYYQNLDSSVILSVAKDLATPLTTLRAGSGSVNNASLDSSPAKRGQNDTFAQLTVTGTSNLYTVSVSNSLLVGTTLFENNTIISLASELKLSALEKINLFDGAVVIAKDGSITTKGELIAQGGVRTNEIRPLTENGQVSIDNLAINKLIINEKFTPATPEAAIIAAADNFAKNGLFAPAFETTTASAGLALLPENSQEVIIYNNNIKKDSLIYLTPTSPTAPIALTVASKETCPADQYGQNSVLSLQATSSCRPYFRVSTPSPTTTPTKFNWLIIN